jgi:two-component system, response regulator RegA
MPPAVRDDSDVPIVPARELVADVRHDLRNHLSTIRNALFYIERKVSSTDIFAADPRLRRFFAIVEGEIASANRLVEHALGRTPPLEVALGTEPTDDRSAETGSMRLLLVDDDESVRLTLAALLEDERFVVDVAESVVAARQMLGAATGYDLVVLDRQLRDGFGVDLVPLVRSSFPDARIALLSGEVPDDVTPAVDACFVKGGAPEDLCRALRRMLPG